MMVMLLLLMMMMMSLCSKSLIGSVRFSLGLMLTILRLEFLFSTGNSILGGSVSLFETRARQTDRRTDKQINRQANLLVRMDTFSRTAQAVSELLCFNFTSFSPHTHTNIHTYVPAHTYRHAQTHAHTHAQIYITHNALYRPLSISSCLFSAPTSSECHFFSSLLTNISILSRELSPLVATSVA